MTKKITEAPPGAWDKIAEVGKRWIDQQTRRSSLEDIKTTVAAMWQRLNKKPPRVLVAESPLQASRVALITRMLLDSKGPKRQAEGAPSDVWKEAADVVGKQMPKHSTRALELALHLSTQPKENVSAQLKDLPALWCYWHRAWAGWFEGATHLGAKFDEDLYNMLYQWANHCPMLIAYDDLAVVSHCPTEIHWLDRELHNEEGPAVRYADGWAVWSITGVRVTQQIVEAPETLTIEQIHAETNEEVRRIAIERFGWMRYLNESGATIVDCGPNDIEATYEILADTPVGQRLLTHCPSTGRRYALALPGDRVSTCEEAQQRLWGNRRNLYIVGRT